MPRGATGSARLGRAQAPMAEHALLWLTGLRLAGVALAAVLVLLAYRAWRASRDRRMMRLGLGFALLLVSLLIEGAIYQVLAPGDLAAAHVAEAVTQLAALGVLIWALF